MCPHPFSETLCTSMLVGVYPLPVASSWRDSRSTGVDEHSPRSRSVFVHVQVSVTRLGHGHKHYEQHGFKPR